MGGTANWKDASTSAATTFANGDAVVFDDAGTAGVVLNSLVSPASVTFDNYSISSSLTGTGSIAGSGSVAIDGFSRVILNNTTADTYTGGTTLNYGDLRISSTAAVSTAGPITVNAGLLEMSQGTYSLPCAITLNEGWFGYGNIINNGGSFTVSDGLVTQVWSGNAALTKNNSNTAILAGTDSYTGGTTINAGALQIGDFSTAGSIAGTVTDNATLQFARSDNITFANATSGSGKLVQTGGGTLMLQGSNSFTGGETVAQSTLTLDYTEQNSNLISSAGMLTLNGGTLNILGNTSSTFTQSTGTLTLGAGASQINEVSGAATLVLGTITRSAGAAINFTNTSSGQLTTTQGLVDGILGGWATYANSDWATASSNVIGAFTGYVTQDNVSSWTTNQVLTDSGSGYTGTLSSNLTIGALRFNTAAASSVTIASGNTLTVGTGGILVTPNVGSNNLTISGGTLTSGYNTAELIVNQNDPNGTLTINSTPGYRNLTKTGPGTLILNAADPLTESGYGTYNVLGGTLEFGPSYSDVYARILNVGAGATLIASSGSNVYYATQPISGAGTIGGTISIQNNLNPGPATGKTGALTFSGTIGPDAAAGTSAFGLNATTPNGTYNWSINNATGTAGAASGWDLVTASNIALNGSAGAGSLNLAVSSNGQYIQNFSPINTYSWPILTNTGSTNLPAVVLQSAAIENPHRGVFSVQNSGNSVNLVYTPLASSMEKTAATNLYNALDFTQPDLSSTSLQQQYQSGQYEAFVDGYRNLFLSRLASFPTTYPGASTTVNNGSAPLQWILNQTTVSTETLIADSDVSTYFLDPLSGAVHTNVSGAVDTGLQQTEVNSDAVEFTLAVDWSGATPSFGGNSALQNMANDAPASKNTGMGGDVGNQELSSAANLVVFSQAFSDFKNVTQVYAGNPWGLGYWTFQAERIFRDPYALTYATAPFNSDGTGLEQANYQQFIPADCLEMMQALGSGSATSNIYTANAPAWLTTFVETAGFLNERYNLMLEYPTGGRIGLASQPPAPGSGSGNRAGVCQRKSG